MFLLPLIYLALHGLSIGAALTWLNSGYVYNSAVKSTLDDGKGFQSTSCCLLQLLTIPLQLCHLATFTKLTAFQSFNCFFMSICIWTSPPQQLSGFPTASLQNETKLQKATTQNYSS